MTDKKSSSFDATRRFARISVHTQVGNDLFSIDECNSESTRRGFFIWHGKCVQGFDFERSRRAPHDELLSLSIRYTISSNRTYLLHSQESREIMKRFVFCTIFAMTSCMSSLSWSQDILGGLLGGQGGGTNDGGQTSNQGGGLRGVIREQIQNAIQPDLPGGQNIPSNAQVQGRTQLNGQVVAPPLQSGSQPIFNNQQGAGTSVGAQLLGVLRANLNDHAAVGQDGTIRFRNDINSQMRGMGILPNDQLVDANGTPIRDLNSANSFLQSNQNLQVLRNGKIVTIHQSSPQLGSNPSQLGWSFGTRNNGVFISSLVTNSIAARAGLRAGDQIVSINGNPVGRSEDITTYLLQANNGPTTIVYLRNGQTGEAYLNSTNQYENPRGAPQSIRAKLDQIERLISEIRAELSTGR